MRRIVLQISNAITPDVKVTLEAAKALSVIRSVDLDPGRVESILKIALSNALNVRPSVSQAAARSLAGLRHDMLFTLVSHCFVLASTAWTR